VVGPFGFPDFHSLRPSWQKPLLRGILMVWSLLLFALFAVLFARGEWAF
jgi:hypothetical protein